MQDRELSRREREKLRQKQEILATALSLFSQHGYHNVSMHQIAEKSEFAIGTLYKFFQNKEDLYKVLILEQLKKFHEACVQTMEQPEDELEKLRAYVRARGELFHDNGAFLRLYLAEARGASFNLKGGPYDEVRELYYDVLKRLSAIFEGGIGKNRFAPIAEPYHLAVALDSTVNAFHLLWLDAPERYPYLTEPDTILNIFLKGLAAQ